MVKKISFVLLLVLAVLVMNLQAGVSALAFGDFYFFSNHHKPDTLDSAGKISNVSPDGQYGFWIRRLYITYDADISDKLKARGRIEMNSDGKFSTTAALLTAFVKDAYISYQFQPLHTLTLGIQEHLSFGNIEKFYGYRHLEKTPLDLHKIRDSRDFGLSLKGSLDAGKKFSYAVMIGNNSGYKHETNKQKAFSLRFTLNPTANWLLEVYGDYIQVETGKKDMLLQAFAGYQGDWGRVGVNYCYDNLSQKGKADSKFNMFSLFGTAKFGKKLEALARLDLALDPQPNGQDTYLIIEKGYKTTVFIAGLGWNLHPKVQVMPNFKLVSYQENNGIKPETDTCFNVTFYYQF
jgi:hypothetical protein